jgi:hypothetical protein
MERLVKHDLAVFPTKAVPADGKSDRALIVPAIHHFKKHVPETLDSEHKGICHKRGRYIRNIGARQNRINDFQRRREIEGRRTSVDSD